MAHPELLTPPARQLAPWPDPAPRPRVLLRLDATAALGLGHLKRCAALAQALQVQGAEVVLAGCSGTLRDTVAAAVAPLRWCELTAAVPADGPPDPQADVAALARAAPWPPHAVVVDHYGIDARWHDAARRCWPGVVLAAIDDLADRPLAVDLLVDHNPPPPGCSDHAAKYAPVLRAPWAGEPTRLLGGPPHALLDRAYTQRQPRAVVETVHTLGVFMGGSDPAGHSLWLLPLLRGALAWHGVLRVATTSANPRLAALRAACAAHGAELLVDQPDLAAFHASCDLQVGAGGGALWERAVLGVPTLALITADNQRASIPAAQTAGAVVALDAIGQTPAQAVAVVQALRRLIDDRAARQALSAASAALVDGRGAARVARALVAELDLAWARGPLLRLRPAGVGDSARLLAWRNDAATRAASLQPGLVDAAAHAAWFSRSLQSPTRRLWIGERGGVPVGTVRADWDPASGWTTLSWTVAPEQRGAGVGRLLVREAVALLRGPLRAEVKPGNAASARIAQAAGLKPAPARAEGEDWVEVYERR